MTTRPLSDDDYRSLAEFRHALRQFLAFSERAAVAHGLTPAHHQLLLTVRGLELGSGPPSISAVADHLLLRSHSAGELVDRAAEQGLVERRGDPSDGRRSLVATTSQGREVLEGLSLLHRRELQTFQSEMSRLLSAVLDTDGSTTHGSMEHGS